MKVNESTVFQQIQESVDRSSIRDPLSEVRNEHSTLGRTSRYMYDAGETERDKMLDVDENVQDHSQRLPSNRIMNYQITQRVPGNVSQMHAPLSTMMRSITHRNYSYNEQRVLPKSVEQKAQNKNFLRNLIGNPRQYADDRSDDQKISLDLGKF